MTTKQKHLYIKNSYKAICFFIIYYYLKKENIKLIKKIRESKLYYFLEY